jgi:hypothetical protein
MSDRREWKRGERRGRCADSFRVESQTCRRADESERGCSTTVGICELANARDWETQAVPGGDARQASGSAIRGVSLPDTGYASNHASALRRYDLGRRCTRGIQPVVDVIE